MAHNGSSKVPARGPGLRGRLTGARSALGAGLASYQRMLAYVRPFLLPLLLAAFSLVIIGLLGLAMPWVVKELVDLVIVGQQTAQLNRLALLMAGIYLLRAVFGFAQTYLIAWVGERVVAGLRREIYEHLLSLSLGFFSEQRVGAIVSRLGSDVQVIQHAVTSNLVTLLQQTVTAAGVIVVVGLMNWRLTLLMAVAMPGVVLVTQVMGRRIRHIARRVQDALAEASAVAEETVGSIRTVQSFAREEYETARFGQKVSELFEVAMRRTRIYALLGPLISLFTYGSLVLVLWVGGQEVLNQRLTPGELIAFLVYAIMLTGPLSSFAGLFGQIQSALGATERIFELLDVQPEIAELPDAKPLPPIAGEVIFHDVSFDYDVRQPVLRHIELKAEPGQVVALVGPSGAGKTTLVHLIPRFYDPTAGKVTIDGCDVRQVTLRSLRDQIGMVPQETLLFGDSVFNNIRYGNLGASRDQVEAAALAANAHEFIINELPDGYDTQVGERGVKLSGGQRQRIAIARAILKAPRVLILDEATSSLDTESERLIQEALERLVHPDGEEAKGRTTFVIAHRLSTIVNADRIAVLHEGQVVEQGTHAELVAREDSLYRHYYSLQFQWTEEESLPDERERVALDPEGKIWPDLSMSIFPSSDAPPGGFEGPGAE